MIYESSEIMELTRDEVLKYAQTMPGNVAVYIAGKELETIYYSPQIPALSGLTDSEYDEIIKKDASDIILKEDRTYVAKKITEAFERGTEIDCVYRIFNKDKGYIWVHATAKKVGESGGKPVLITIFLNTSLETDVYSELLDSLDNIVYVISRENWDILYANKYALHMWEKIDDYTGKKCHEFVNGTSEPCQWCSILKMGNKDKYSIETYDEPHKCWLRIECKKSVWRDRPAYIIRALDISEEKKAHRKLENEKTELQKIIDGIPTGVVVYNINPKGILFEAANPYAVDLLNVEGDIGNSQAEFYKRVYREDKTLVISAMKQLSLSGGKASVSFRYSYSNGIYKWLHIEATTVTQPDGTLRVFSNISDVTNQKETELENLRSNKILSERNRELYNILNYVPAGTCVFRKTNGRIVCISANPYYSELIGIPQSKLVGESFEEIEKRIHPDDRARHESETVSLLEKQRSSSGTYRFFNNKSGRYIWLHIEARLIVQPDGIEAAYFSYTDITDRKEMEEQLNESRMRYKLAIEGAKLAVWEYDVREHKIFSPENALSVHGVPDVIENVPESMFPMFAEGESEKLKKMYAELESGKKDIVTGEFWAKWISGQPRRCERITYSIVKDSSGKPVKAYGIGQIITEQKLAEEQYKQSMQDLLSTNPMSLCTFRLNLSKNSCSDGHSASEFILNNLSSDTADGFFENVGKLIHDEKEYEKFQKIFNCEALITSYVTGKTQINMNYRREFTEKTMRWVTTYLKMVRNPNSGDIEAIIYSFDTDAKKTEEEISQYLTDEEYDYIAILNAQTEKIQFTHSGKEWAENNETLFSDPEKESSYNDVMEYMANKWISSKNRADFYRNASTEKIIDALSRTGQYEFNVLEKLQGKRVTCRQIRCRYLDDLRSRILITQRDITDMYLHQQREVNEIKEESEKTKDILNSVLCGIAVIRVEKPDKLTTEYANDQMYYMLGFDEEHAGEDACRKMKDDCRNNIIDYIDPDDAERVKQIFIYSFDKSGFVIENFGFRKSNGEYLRMSAEARVRESAANYRVFYIVLRDISEELRLKGELFRRLDREQELRQKATEANKAKSDFLSNVSHDMRTPLNAVIGYTDLAIKSEGQYEIADYLKKIRKSENILLDLINDTLDLSRIESGKTTLTYAPVNSEELFAQILSAVNPEVEKKHIILNFRKSISPLPNIYADSMRVSEIYMNILSNAVKFTPEGGKIEFITECKYIKENEIRYKVIIRDSGPGIGKEFLPKVFEPFAQERTKETANAGGSGLGLAIVKSLTDKMGGTISVDSELGKGTEFTVVLDFEHAEVKEEKRIKEKAPQENTLKGKKVLLCEDNVMNTEIAKTLLEMRGIEVVCAENGAEGVEIFKKSAVSEVDAVLMDIRMPVMDGYTAAKEIRKLEREDSKTVPIIAMTADAYAADVEKANKAGMNAHIAKPVDAEKLYGTLWEFMRK